MTLQKFLTDIERDECRLALRQLYGCDARFNATVAVVIPLCGRSPWRGAVHVFDISGHASATRGYAWPRRVNARTTIIHTELESETVVSAEQAVRKALRRHKRIQQQ